MSEKCESCRSEDVIAEITRAHARHLAAVARHEGLTADDALDAVQESLHRFLVLRRERDLSAEAGELRALLAAIVRNEARNMRRRHHRSVAHDDLEAATLHSPEASGIALLEAREDHTRLIGCVRQLGDRERAVVTLRMLEELSSAEAAEALGLTPGHVAVLLHRAKRELHQCMCG